MDLGIAVVIASTRSRNLSFDIKVKQHQAKEGDLKTIRTPAIEFPDFPVQDAGHSDAIPMQSPIIKELAWPKCVKLKT
ncbi:hypothetical protein [Roseobacter sp. GAI101]|uniref:hypothetical protein n=1 Tax=Roseobacter sp. (strain GAI101) TaxID=391589 RepID=UPI0018DCDA31|nr:hypothetical protein [Roseobacter sp. GAI101]